MEYLLLKGDDIIGTYGSLPSLKAKYEGLIKDWLASGKRPSLMPSVWASVTNGSVSFSV